MVIMVDDCDDETLWAMISQLSIKPPANLIHTNTNSLDDVVLHVRFNVIGAGRVLDSYICHGFRVVQSTSMKGPPLSHARTRSVT